MESNIRKEIEKAVRSDNAVELLKVLVLQLHEKGLETEEIYDHFYDKFLEYQRNNLAREESLVGEIMDMLTGNPSPQVSESES